MAFAEADSRVRGQMATECGGKTAVCFIRGKIQHHQGAVEMATTVPEQGQDPKVRKLAEGIIAAPETEINRMADRLARNGD